jgi:phage regulator Rha-like protein
MEELVISKNEVLVVSSRLFAEGFEVEHRALLQLIKTYQETIEGCFGQVAFEMETVKNSVGAVNETKTAYFTEDQAMFIGTLLRNTVKAVQFKVNLVKKFSEMKKLLEKPRELTKLEYIDLLRDTELERLEALQKVENLTIALDSSLEWCSIIKCSTHNKIHESVFKWQTLKKKSIELGYEVKRLPSTRYDYQLAYHVNCFRACYPQYNYNFNNQFALI